MSYIEKKRKKELIQLMSSVIVTNKFRDLARNLYEKKEKESISDIIS